MRLAIADPPYLGRASLWYGGKGASKRPKSGCWKRVKGRPEDAPEYHPDAAKWDDPEEHTALMAEMEARYDGWALAASAKTLTHLHIPDRARIAIWHVTNAIPDGGRVRSTWEAVIVRVPEGRRAYGTGLTVPDVLRAPHPRAGFVGTKPPAWTRWVLDMLGFDPHLDELEDLFPGSGSVSHAAGVLF